MVTILGINLNRNNRFVSIRWKLVSTYLLLIVIFIIIVNVFITRTFLNLYIQQTKVEMLANANIIANRTKYFLKKTSMISFRDMLQREIEDYSTKIDSRILIINKKSIVKADSSYIYTDKSLEHLEIQKALKGKSAVNTYSFKGIGHIMYIAVPIISDDEVLGAAIISTSLNNLYDRVGEIRRTINIISLISIMFIIIVSFLFAEFFSKPIKKLTEAITRMSQGNLGEKVYLKSNDEFKHLATAFNIMSTKLDQVDTQRKNFVSNVSHELRTPLTSIKILSESLLHENESNVEVYREFLEDIDSEVDRLNNIIKDLLVLVDLDKEKLTLDYKVTYVNFLLEKIIRRLKPLAEEKNITIDYSTKGKVQINLDPNKVQQAIINIIHNAIKYTPAEGEVKIKLYQNDKWIVINVQDTGIGIPEEKLPHIFERFYRVDKARTRSTGGTGLGLSIAHQIITLHQGTIEVESKVGKGTVFYIKLPRDINEI